MYRSLNKLISGDQRIAQLRALKDATEKNPVISKNSRFNDSVWDFFDLSDRNVSVHSRGKISIDWIKLPNIPGTLILETKMLVYYFIHVGGRKAITACTYTQSFLRFLNAVCEEYSTKYGSRHISLVNHLVELDISIVRSGLEKCRLNTVELAQVKMMLKFMLECGIGDIFDGPFLINRKAIKNCIIGSKGYEDRKYDKVMGDKELNFLVNESAYLVCIFLTKLEPDHNSKFVQEVAREIRPHKRSVIEKINDLPLFLKRYREYRASNNNSYNYMARKEIHSIIPCGLNDWLTELVKIHSAALYLILQFTGMRYSEAADIRSDDLRTTEHGLFVIKGAVKKHRQVKMNNNDIWVAIPIVQAAIRVALQLGGMCRNEFVFAPFMRSSETGWLARNSLNNRMNKFLYDIDDERKFSMFSEAPDKKRWFLVNFDSWITLQRIRQTIASQMIRGNINISSLSWHFKHLYLTENNLSIISEVTLGYGNARMEIFTRKLDLKKLKSLYIEALKKTERFFTRKNASISMISDLAGNVEHESMLEQSLIDLGIAYCIGRNKIRQVNGVFIDPPCVKSGGCQAISCANAVFVKEKVNNLKAYYDSKVKQLEDPAFSYLRPQLTRLTLEVEKIIKQLD